MERNREISLTSSNDEGVNSVRARPGKFAFFMESTIIEYYMERKCRLVQIGGLLDHKGYGIALHKGRLYNSGPIRRVAYSGIGKLLTCNLLPQ